MPVNKPTISHQLKTVKSNKTKIGGVIHVSPNNIASAPHSRSHLRGGGSYWKKSSYDGREEVVNVGDISQSELKKCTRILRNVLANEENKSTSTDECDLEERIVKTRSVGFKSPDLSTNTDRESDSERVTELAERADDLTEADSLTSVAEVKTPLTNNSSHSQGSSRVKTLSARKEAPNSLCTCHEGVVSSMQVLESKRLAGYSDCIRVNNDKPTVCSRCHNIIPPTNGSDKEVNMPSRHKNPDLGCDHERYTENHNFKSHTPYGNGPAHFESFGDEKIDNITGLIQSKLAEVGSIARATRDADLDRLVCEIDRLLQQMMRENALVFNHVKTIAKTLKWDNSGLKQKMKSQSEANRDTKSEMRLLRQDNKQKVEEFKLELQLKCEEIRQLTEKDQNILMHWRDKYQSLEKEHEKMRCEYQGQVLQACQKDTEIIQVKHSCTQSEARLKENIHSLMLVNQNLQTELSKAQETNRKYEQECLHNQCIIKAAREHVVNLLDRHRHDREGVSSGSCRFDQAHDAPISGSGDWINQATSLQQVLSMISDGKDGHNQSSSSNYFPVSSRINEQSRSLTISPINFATANNNNNYMSSATCNPNDSGSTMKDVSYNAAILKSASIYQDNRDLSRSPSEISSTVSRNSLDFSIRNKNENNLYHDSHDKSYELGGKFHPVDCDNGITNHAWRLDIPKVRMSSSSSVMSTVSSLRSTDDREFRNGLQKLDSQISRLQTTLQSKLQCK